MHRKTRRGAPRTSWGQGGKEGESVPEEVILIKSLEDVGAGRKVFPEEQMQACTYMEIAVCSTGEKESWGMLGYQATN